MYPRLWYICSCIGPLFSALRFQPSALSMVFVIMAMICILVSKLDRSKVDTAQPVSAPVGPELSTLKKVSGFVPCPHRWAIVRTM